MRVATLALRAATRFREVLEKLEIVRSKLLKGLDILLAIPHTPLIKVHSPPQGKGKPKVTTGTTAQLTPVEKALAKMAAREQDPKGVKWNNQQVVRATKQSHAEGHIYNDWRNW